MVCSGITHCSECGEALEDYELGVCCRCENKVLNPSKKCGGYIEKQVVKEALDSCYISKQKLRKIINNYSIRKRNGSLFFNYEYAPDFVNEILELAGYRVKRRR